MSDQDKRRRIVQASEALFAVRRFHEVKLDDVAREAGVAKGTIYLYFKSKDDLFIETIAAGFDDMLTSLREEASPDIPFRERLQRACETITSFHQRRRPLWHTIHGESGTLIGRRGKLKEKWLSFQEERVAVIGNIFRQGIQSGDVRSDLSPALMATCLLGILRGRRRFTDHLQPDEQELSASLEVLFKGIEARK